MKNINNFAHIDRDKYTKYEKMEDGERVLLLKINELHKQLLIEPNGRFINNMRLEPSGYTYTKNMSLLVKNVAELFNEYNPDYLTLQDLESLYHTNEKEVAALNYMHDKAIKNRAPNKRKTELISQMYIATKHIERDIFSTFDKIEKLS